jgi:hypothetical protein
MLSARPLLAAEPPRADQQEDDDKWNCSRTMIRAQVVVVWSSKRTPTIVENNFRTRARACSGVSSRPVMSRRIFGPRAGLGLLYVQACTE